MSPRHGLRCAVLLTIAVAFCSPARAGIPETSLRFYGHGGSPGDNFIFPDRVRVPIEPDVPADVGSTDFTIEFWMKATAAENPNGPQSCGFGIDWVNGNILIDRDRYGQGRKFGISLLGGTIAWGVSSDFVDYTLCGSVDVLDDAWHHVAVGRRFSDGTMWIFVDGALDATGPGSGGPSGDVSYPDGGAPGHFCSPDGGSGGQPCPSDDYLVFGAEKHGFGGINFSGALDEIRLSNVLRYTGPFARPTTAFATDANTMALYHFNEDGGTLVGDASGAGGGPSDGLITFGGSPPPGPEWSDDSPFTSLTGIAPQSEPAARLLGLGPNPFRSRLALTLELREAQPLEVRVYDASGRTLGTIWRGARPAGRHEISWFATDRDGDRVASGTYFLRWRAGQEQRTHRVVLIR